jgi:hypothetical protein
MHSPLPVHTQSVPVVQKSVPVLVLHPHTSMIKTSRAHMGSRLQRLEVLDHGIALICG